MLDSSSEGARNKQRTKDIYLIFGELEPRVDDRW